MKRAHLWLLWLRMAAGAQPSGPESAPTESVPAEESARRSAQPGRVYAQGRGSLRRRPAHRQAAPGGAGRPGEPLRHRRHVCCPEIGGQLAAIVFYPATGLGSAAQGEDFRAAPDTIRPA